MIVLHDQFEYEVAWTYAENNDIHKDKIGRRKIDHKKSIRTSCSIVDKNGIIIATGWADKNPQDQFEPSRGRMLSLTRALIDFPKEVRIEFWKKYALKHRDKHAIAIAKHFNINISTSTSFLETSYAR